MLLLGGAPAPDALASDALLESVLATERAQAASRGFLAKEVALVPAERSVYVGQQEMAVVKPGVASAVGSTAATTCVIACLWDPATQLCSLAHLDGSQTRGTVTALLAAHPESHPLELHLVGAAFCDDRDRGQALLHDVLQTIRRSAHQVEVVTACVGALNTENKDGLGYPRQSSLAIRPATGEVFPADFASRGPMCELRHSRFLGGGGSTGCYPNVIDADSGQFVVAPFPYRPMRRETLQYYLQCDDEELLGSLSTSPHCEPPTFCSDLRDMFRFMLENRSFPGTGALRFTCGPDGMWCRVEQPERLLKPR